MASLVEKYNEEGYLIIRNVIPPKLVEEASAHVEWLQKKHPEVFFQLYIKF